MSESLATRPHLNAAVQREIDRAIAAGHETGVQVAAYLDGELVVDAWGGSADPATDRPVDGETLFNVFSVTKAVAATALHIQAERGLIDYEAPVARYWPEYASKGKEGTLVSHVLTHRAGVPQMPDGVTPEQICDWELMVRRIADLEPLAEPGSRTMYLAMTFGWLVGELVRRTDPQGRSFGRFVREELAAPLGISDLWIGVPDEVEPRIARLTNAAPPRKPEDLPPLYTSSMPPAVGLTPEVFERPDVRRAEVPGVGGVFNARSCARFWALLAQGGELDGVRLLSKARVANLYRPRANSDEPDPVLMNVPLPISVGGYWLGIHRPPLCAVKNPRAICHPGAGNSIGWADLERRFAVAICHNRMSAPRSCEEDSLAPIADAIRKGLGIG